MKHISIGGRTIGPGYPVFIIAEAGVNHNGNLDLALKLVDAAAEAGADAVKFQTFKAEQLVTSAGKMAAYQKKNTGTDQSQLAMLKKLELPESFYGPIITRCKERKIIFLSAAHGGFESVDTLLKLKVPGFKFSSADLTNLPTLAYAARSKKPIILSTGMANMEEVREAVTTVKKADNNNIVVLQCTTDYPTNPNEIHLNVMQEIAKQCNVIVGFSDHSIDAQAGIMAATLGAQAIERHLTLDKTMEGPDHAASSSPQEFADYVRAVRRVPSILGSKVKKPSASEKQYIPLVRKSVVAKKDVSKGEKFTTENLAIKRPGTGLPPRHFLHLLGKRAKRNITADTVLTKRDV